MSEYIILTEPMLAIREDEAYLHIFRFAINTKENIVKLWDEVTNEFYDDTGGIKRIGDLLGFIKNNKPIAQSYYTKVYKRIEVK